LISGRTILLTLGMVGAFLCIRWVHITQLNSRLIGAVYSQDHIDKARVKAALAQGASPNAKGPKDVMVLSWAARAGDTATMQLLLDAGADPNCRGGWLPALNMAAAQGHTSAVELLLSRGADPNTDSWGGRSRRAGSWALVLAVSAGHLPVARSLLMHGADPNSRDQSGASALRIARRHHPAIAGLLEKAGARE
jgi:uncharacterized protein